MKVTLDLEEVEWLLGEARGAFRMLHGHLGSCIPNIGAADARRISEIEMKVQQQVRDDERGRTGTETATSDTRDSDEEGHRCC